MLPVTIKNIAPPFQLHNAYLVAYYRDCISICTSEEAFYYDVYFRHEVFKFTCVLAAKVHVYGKRRKKKTTFEGINLNVNTHHCEISVIMNKPAKEHFLFVCASLDFRVLFT